MSNPEDVFTYTTIGQISLICADFGAFLEFPAVWCFVSSHFKRIGYSYILHIEIMLLVYSIF